MARAPDVRHLLLGLIPRQPDRISTTDLVRLLAAQGIGRTPRAVQKMCADLAFHEAELICDERTKPYQWAWSRNARIREYPPMNAHAALTLRIAFEQAKYLLPASTLDHLRHQQRRAEEVLATAEAMRTWRRKIRVLPRGLGHLPPTIAPEVLRTVYEALLSDRRLEVTYRRWNQPDDESFDVTPLALVVRESLLTLIVTIGAKAAPRQLHLHRMRAARMVDGKPIAPTGFDIDRHIRDGHLGFLQGDAHLRLRLRLFPAAIQNIGEMRIAPDQTLTAQADGTTLLEATVADTLDLRGWLKSYGAKLEVLAPDGLRKELAEELKNAAALYARPTRPRRSRR